jgi:hypothetical protein
MGNQSSGEQQQERLVQRVSDIRLMLEMNKMSPGNARELLNEIMLEIKSGKTGLEGKALQLVLSKMDEVEKKIQTLERLLYGNQEISTSDSISQSGDEVPKEIIKPLVLKPLYAQDYGRLNPVATLLEVGQKKGGYRSPDEYADPSTIGLDVHRIACKDSGFSSYTSTSNGLVNRIREQSLIVTQNAYENGYDITDDDVQAGLAVLAREIAFTLDSDSGDRDYKKEHNPRGMSYNLDTRVPGLDPSVSKGGFSREVSAEEKLESHKQALVALQFRISRANGEDRAKLVREKERIEKEIQELQRKKK